MSKHSTIAFLAVLLAVATVGPMGNAEAGQCVDCVPFDLPLPGGGSEDKYICWPVTYNGWNGCQEVSDGDWCWTFFDCDHFGTPLGPVALGLPGDLGPVEEEVFLIDLENTSRSRCSASRRINLPPVAVAYTS